MILTKTEEQIKTKEVLNLFAQASMDNDLELIESLLHDDGEFQFEFIDAVAICYNKTEFLIKYAEKLKEIPITKITEDQCGNCSIGQNIVLFNDGWFPTPFIIELISFKCGFKITLKDDKIMDLELCTTFINSENPCIYLSIKDLERQGYKFFEGYTNAILAKTEAEPEIINSRPKEIIKGVTEDGKEYTITIPYGYNYDGRNAVEEDEEENGDGLPF